MAYDGPMPAATYVRTALLMSGVRNYVCVSNPVAFYVNGRPELASAHVKSFHDVRSAADVRFWIDVRGLGPSGTTCIHMHVHPRAC